MHGYFFKTETERDYASREKQKLANGTIGPKTIVGKGNTPQEAFSEFARHSRYFFRKQKTGRVLGLLLLARLQMARDKSIFK